MLRVQNGLLEWVEQQQPAATQAEPHAPISMPEQENSGDHVRPPRAQTGRPATIMMATKKRRASELDREGGGEIQNGRKTKVYVSYCAFIHRCLCMMCFTESQARPYLTQSVYYRNGFFPIIGWVSVALFSCFRYTFGVWPLCRVFCRLFLASVFVMPVLNLGCISQYSLWCAITVAMSFTLSHNLLPFGVHLQI